MEEKVSMTLPVKFNLFDMVTVRRYEDSPEYNERKKVFLKEVESKKAQKRTVNIALWLILAAFLVYLVFTGHTFLVWVAGIIGAIICGGITMANSPNDVSSYFDTSKEDDEIGKEVINELIKTNFPGAKYIFSWGNALIYNNDIFAYMSIKEGLLVVYSHNNFRGMSWKEVAGSHGSYGDQYDFILPEHGNIATIKYIGRGYKKELLVEISTNYLEYPSIKFTVPATKGFDEELKIAGNIIN